MGPGIHCQGTVTTIPVTRQCITFLVTYTIIGFALTICKRARGWLRLHGYDALLAPFTCPATLTLTVEVWKGGLFSAQPSIAAGLGRAAFITEMLTLGTTKTFQADASCTPCSKCTATSIVAGQLTTGQAPFAVRPGVTLKIPYII